MPTTSVLSVLRFALAITCCSFVFPLQAAQPFRVDDGDTIAVDISSRELTRVAVTRDGRLDKIWGAAGIIDVQADTDRGEIYIRPLPGAPSVISFFVSDVSGGTYTIVATQRDIPSETILLDPAARRLQMADSSRDRSLPIVDRVKVLMKSMANREELDGYYREPADQVVPLWHETKIHLREFYETTDLHGEVYSVENISGSVMTFHESEFMDFGTKVLAVALEQLALKPGEDTRLFIVRRAKLPEG